MTILKNISILKRQKKKKNDTLLYSQFILVG